MFWRRNDGASLLVVPALTALLLNSAPAAALETTRVSVARDAGDGRMELIWSSAVTVKTERRGDELVLRFSRPLGDVKLDDAQERLSGLADNIQYGYDSLLVTAAPGVTIKTTSIKNGVRIDIKTKMGANVSPLDPAAERERRLERLRVAAMMGTGDTEAAATLAAHLVNQSPRDVETLRLAGEAEEKAGRPIAAMGYYRRALDEAPGDEALKRAHARLRLETADFTRFEVETKFARHADTQIIGRLTGSVALDSTTRVLYGNETRHMSIASLTRPSSGERRRFEGTRTKMDLSVERDWTPALGTTLTLHGSPRDAGATVAGAVRDEKRETSASISLAEPWFDATEALAFGGRRDRLRVVHTERPTNDVSFSLGGALNRYGIGALGGAATSRSLEASARWTAFNGVPDGRPTVTLAYTLDAEYVAHVKRKLDVDGEEFKPLALSSREVHALGIETSGAFLDDFRYEATGGYAFDRINQGGAFVSGALSYQPSALFEVGVRASRSQSLSDGTTTTVDSGAGYLTLRY